MYPEIKQLIEKIEQQDINDKFDSLKHLNAIILATTLISGEFTEQYLNDIKKLIPTLKLPDTTNILIENIIERKLQRINN